MSNQFLKLRRSAVPGKIPETSSLDFGELAINTFDGQLFLKKSGSQGPIVTVVGSTGSFTGSFTGNGAGLINIPASGITGLNLSRIATGSVTASVSTDISASFRITSGSNTLLNVTREGFVWIGNGTFTNQAYQLDVNGNTRVSGNLYIGNAGHYLLADTNNFRIYDKNSNILFQAFPVGVFDNELYIQSGVGKIYVNASNAGATILDGAVGSSQPETFIIKRGYFANVSPTTKNVFKVQTQYYSNISNGTILRGIYVDIDDTSTYTGFADVRAFESLKGGGYFNTTNVAASAILQADSTTKGFLAPRMTAAQRTAISTPAQGLIVYDTGSATEGLWFYNSGSNPGWQEVLTNSGSQSISGSITASAALITGTLTAQTLVVQTITSSILYSSGSNIFGNRLTDTQQFTGSVLITGSTVSLNGGSFSGSGANLFDIPASGITGLNLSRIATGSISASVNTDISSSFRLTSGSNTLLNVTRDGLVWIGNGTFTNQAYQLDVQGTLRATGDFQFGSSAFIGTAVGFKQTTSPAVGSPFYYMYASGDAQRTGVQIEHRSDATGLMVGTTTNNVSLYGVGTPSITFNGGPLRISFRSGANHLVGNIAVVSLPTNTNTFTIATSVQDYHDFSYLTPGSYFIGGNSGLLNGNIQNYFFGGGKDNTGNTKAARNVTFYATFPDNFTNSDGGNFTITGGRGTGTGSAGDVIFSTANITGSGTALQALADRWWVKGLTGTLSNVSNPPSASLYVSGSFIVNGAQFNNTSSVTSAGITTVSQLSTSSYTSCFYNYTVASASNARSGQVMTVWNGNSLRYIEVVTTDIGDTNLVAVSASLSSGFVRLQVSASSGWTFKNISNLL